MTSIMEKQQNKQLIFEYQGEEIQVEYEYIHNEVLKISMSLPYVIEIEYKGDEIKDTISHDEDLKKSVEIKSIELYDLIRKTEVFSDTLSEVQKMMEYYKSKTMPKDEKAADEYLNKRLKASLYYFFGLDKEVGLGWRDKISPSLLPKLLKTELADSIKNDKKNKTIIIEYEEEKAIDHIHPGTIKGSFTFYKKGENYGFSIKLTEPFEVDLPTVWDDDLSRYRSRDHIEEYAGEIFKSVAKLIDYFFTRRQISEALYTKTGQLHYALTYIKYEGGFTRDLIDNFDEFMEFSFERYYQLLVSDFIEQDDIVGILEYVGFHFFSLLFEGFLQEHYPR